MSTKQKKDTHRRSPSRGVVLIFVAGILTILAAVGMAFFAVTNSSVQSAVRYSDMVRADLLARAGIHDAIARLREQAFTKTEDPSDPWFMTNYMNNQQTRFSFIAKTSLGKDLPYSRALGSSVTDQGDRFTLQIHDAASKINVNAGDNLAVILDNLCRLIGPPLVAANLDALQPRRWAEEGATDGLYNNALNAVDQKTERDVYYRLVNGRPVVDADGVALYGDGYAIAGYRSRNGRFGSLEEIRQALTYVERNGNTTPDDTLEQLEIEVKFRVLKEYLTTDSWVDTNTVGVGKFEWVGSGAVSDVREPQEVGVDVDPKIGPPGVKVYDLQKLKTDKDAILCQILIDRDKSWIADDPVNDPLNERGSLRGAYVSIMNGHGAGQLRRIATNGTDWLALRAYDPDEQMTVPPGPISSYLIMAREDALLELVANTTPPTYVPRVRGDGSMPDDPAVDYAVRPLCIHRAPVNINTASDKVLAALFMGIDVQHGHPMAVGTDAEYPKVVPYPPLTPAEAAAMPTVWKKQDYTNRSLEPYLLTMKGLKRVPADSGKVVFDRGRPAQAPSPTYDYIDNYGLQSNLNAAQELAHRIIVARQATDWGGAALGADPYVAAYPRGPFKNYDDLYFRVVKPWDDARDKGTKVSVARLIMANFNSNTDILKFNPGIEWIDRYGRNFTEMEPVMAFVDTANEPTWVPFVNVVGQPSDGMFNVRLVNQLHKDKGSYVTRSLRYKADDLIDKTDLNRSTTEFAFDSGGIYEITSTGQVFGQVGLLAERKMETLVKVYDVWRESTQDQFMRGYISEATGNQVVNGKLEVTDPNRSGRIVRDARNTMAPYKRLALDTLPEPLVPLGYTVPTGGGGNTDLVSTNPYDAWQNPKSQKDVPDVVSNRVLPARYDGQIALAVNTSKYGETGDTFLASFDGDLDTGTCAGNGREQAKVPSNCKIRVLDTISLLGLLNDTQVDFDPAPKDVFVVTGANAAMQALDPAKYWHNVTCRMGDLRPEGVFLGNVGASGRDSTIKYPVDGNWPVATPVNNNNMQYAVRMWMKPTWHQDDGQEHEFFNGCNVGDGALATGAVIAKEGKFSSANRSDMILAPNTIVGGGGNDVGCLKFTTEDYLDYDSYLFIHGGAYNVPLTADLKVPNKESPSYRVQPFRWHYLGGVVNYDYYITTDANSVADSKNWDALGRCKGDDMWRGHWAYGGGEDLRHVEMNKFRQRLFIDTVRIPEGSADSTKWWKYHYGMTNIRCMQQSDLGNNPLKPQKADWDLDNLLGASADTRVWSINNLNTYFLDNSVNPPLKRFRWLYRACASDGTQAVVDELKISVTKLKGANVGSADGGGPLAGRVWCDNRFATEMITSRYYLPNATSPADPYYNKDEQPTFTSQTLLSSLRGSTSLAGDEVTVVRVSWNCFTPRFMHDNKTHQTARTRAEAVGGTGVPPLPPNNSNAILQQQVLDLSYRGPFDYIHYNLEILPGVPPPTAEDQRPGEASFAGNAPTTAMYNGVNALACDRPARKDYPVDAESGIQQPHASKGVEVELIEDINGIPENTDTILGGITFTNPDGRIDPMYPTKPPMNSLGDSQNPIHVKSGQLRYRVRFKYPVDHFVRGLYNMTDVTVNPTNHYMVDTPVFDDISVTYFTKTRILAYREVSE